MDAAFPALVGREGPVPFDQLFSFVIRQQRKVCQPRLGCLRHGCEQAIEMTEHAGDRRMRKPPVGITDDEAQIPPRFHHQRKGIVVASRRERVDVARPRGQRFDAQRRLLTAVRSLRITFEHDQALEKRRPVRNVAPSLDVAERGPFILAQRRVPLLQVTQPVPERLVRSEAHSNRQAVDEQPDHLLDAGEFRGTPRHGRSEQNVDLSAIAMEQEGPGPLQQGIHRDLHPLCQGLERLHPVRRQHQGLLGKGQSLR